MRRIDALKEVQALIGETYMYAVIIALAALLLAFIIAYIVKFQGGKDPKDHIVRRIWYIVIGLSFPIMFFLYNSLYVSSYIVKVPLQAMYSNANIIATIIVFLIYLAVGVITMLVFPRTKWGSILGRK